MKRIVFVVVLVAVPWCAATAQVPQIERDALIALYTSTDGPNWIISTSWLGAVGTECTWYGVGCSGGHVSSLVLYSNGLVGDIPPALGDLTDLVLLYLFSNQLTGVIPPQIGSMESLQDLRLGPNQLTGSIPSELGGISALTTVVLSGNQLTGSIPPELGNLSSLTTLSLNANQLSGSIPPELGSLTSLRNLYLNGNQLTGSIPPELGDLPSVMSLDLSMNQLTGGIPLELASLSTLEILNLSSNPLEGGIPPEVGDLLNLQDLRLSSCQLTGSIPPELGALSSLVSLDVSSNRLSGNVPPEIVNLQILHTLRLDGNHLSGVIPPELGALSNLEYLYLDSNSLEGSIPPELGGLASLQYLHLSSNRLVGDIPLELGSLSALENGFGLDLRFNALHSDDASLTAFLNQKQINGDWQSTQTLAPEDVVVEWLGDHTVWLSWSPVSYQSNPGGYEVFVSPVAAFQWVSVGKTSAKTELEFPASGLGAGVSCDLAVASYTLPHAFNDNTVASGPGAPIMVTTADTGCATPVIDISWGSPTTLSLADAFDSYLWSTGETGPTIDVDPANARFYWVTVTSPGPCRESAIVLVDPLLFSDGFESGDLDRWGAAAP